MSVPRMAYNSREVKKIYRFTESSNYCKGNLEMSRLEQEHQKLRKAKPHLATQVLPKCLFHIVLLEKGANFNSFAGMQARTDRNVSLCKRKDTI